MNFFEVGQELTEKEIPFVTVTLISIRGSVPQDPGAKMIITREGRYQGTVGGGRIELNSIKKAQAILEGHLETPPELVTWNLQRDIGMSCGGEATLLFEHTVPVKWKIALFGAGHVGQAMIATLKNLNCEVTCIDSREEWISKIEGVKTIHHPHPKDVVPTLDPKSFFVVMTMGHDHDYPILLEIFRHHPECSYVGVIGSKIKGMKIKKQLEEAGASEAFLEKLRVPMGYPVGTNHPYEIAISISAELLGVRDSLRA